LGLNKNEIDFICPDFPYEGICQRFRKEAVKYGFIERYQEGKEDITKVSYESWHFRYVGVEAAEEIMSQGLTLEEYMESVE